MGRIDKTQAVILAGGLGTRLRPYTFLLPKPMLPVGSKPIIEHILGWLRENDVSEAIISTGYLGRMIEEYLRDGKQVGVRVIYASANRPMGIAGQLKEAESLIKGRFVCVYGDAILRFDLKGLLEFHAKKRATATMALMRYSTSLKYGFMETDSGGRLREWKEKPAISGYINVGCYAMEKRFLKYIPRGTMFGMKEAFEAAKKAGEALYGYRTRGEFLDIGDRRSYRQANEAFMEKLGKLP